ncbi:MAG TPA: pitrilysin family protein [Labilithrix sp.]|jgi:predicted Zn-dependent peptidase
MRPSLLALAALFLAACGGPAPSAPTIGQVPIGVNLRNESFVLPNGLQVVLHNEPSAGHVVVHVRYHVGSKDDPAGRAGFAHLFEHLMFRGTKNAPNDYGTYLDAVGADFNATTGLDSTDYFETVSARQLPLALWLEADRMAFPLATLDEDGFAKERNVVMNEYRERYGNVPYGNVTLIARAAVFGDWHPYALSPIGRLDEIGKATLDEARAFRGTYYGPNNATLVIAGNLDVVAARALVTKYFATIPPAQRAVPRRVAAPVLAESRTIEAAADVDTPMIAYAWPAPGVHGDGYEELAIGTRALGGWLTHRLVIEKELAREVQLYLVSARLASVVILQVKTKPGIAPAAITSEVELFLRYASEIGRVGRGWSEFEDQKTRALAGEVFGLEDMDERARRLLHGLEYHGEPDSVQSDLQRVDDIPLWDIGAAMERFLKDAPRVTVVVRPDPRAPRAGAVR